MINTDFRAPRDISRRPDVMRYEVECGSSCCVYFSQEACRILPTIWYPTLVGAELAGEKHYSVPELAKLWGLSERTIRRMFENEPGVLCWGSSESRSNADIRPCAFPKP